MLWLSGSSSRWLNIYLRSACMLIYWSLLRKCFYSCVKFSWLVWTVKFPDLRYLQKEHISKVHIPVAVLRTSHKRAIGCSILIKWSFLINQYTQRWRYFIEYMLPSNSSCTMEALSEINTTESCSNSTRGCHMSCAGYYWYYLHTYIHTYIHTLNSSSSVWSKKYGNYSVERATVLCVAQVTVYAG